MFDVWNKDKIKVLSIEEKEQWFDVLNYKLEEDREISFDDPKLSQKQKEIKTDYMKYLESCPNRKEFYKYYIYRDQNKIISVCRINVYEGKHILEGLETHRDYYRMGYGSKLIQEMINDLKKDGIKTLYSEARVWNDASNNLQSKLGFIRYGEENNNYLYKLDLDKIINGLNKGLDIFGKAYGTMYRNDLHDKDSVDYKLLESMILLNEKSYRFLYYDYLPNVNHNIKLHELYTFAQRFKADHDIKTIKNVLSFTKDIVETFNVPFNDMFFGGTEKEIINRGTDWCTDISRVGCVLLQCLNIPCRMVYLANKKYAYNGHAVCELFVNNEFILCDFTYGVHGVIGENHSIFNLISNQKNIKQIYNDFCISQEMTDYFVGMFSNAGISDYDAMGNYLYTTTKANEYYKKLMTIEQDGQWKMGEDK
jgi:RimJ/RimL family protein N-acetyltransferase